MRTVLGVVAVAMWCLAIGAMPAHAADCSAGCTLTVAPGPGSTFAIPADATSVVVTVAAGSGGVDLRRPGSTAAPGGALTVDLGTAYNGLTLHLVAGRAGFDRADFSGTDPDGHVWPIPAVGAGGGGGSFVSIPGQFVVVAGGGGGANLQGNGGAGGFAAGPPDGQDATPAASFSGAGAVGTNPGGTGTVSTVAPDGVIDPNDEDIGEAPTVSTTVIAGAWGGGGLAAGGIGFADLTIVDEISLDVPPQPIPAGSNPARAGGGGSGFLAPALTALTTGPNLGDGFITIAWVAPAAAVPTPAGAGGGAILARSGGEVVSWWPAVPILAAGLVLVGISHRSRRRESERDTAA